MAYLSTEIVCTCPKWRKLEADQKADRRWQMAHQLLHNVNVGRPPFTVRRMAELADCTPAQAKQVLDFAVAWRWFTLVPEALGQPAHYRKYAKPK